MSKKAKKLSPLVRIAGLLLLVLIILYPFRLFLDGSFDSNQEANSPATHNLFLVAVIFGALGGACLILGIMIYLSAYLSHCFTFNFSKPIFPSLKFKLFILKIVVASVAIFAIGFLLTAILMPIGSGLGIPGSLIFFVSLFGPLLIIQLCIIFVDILHPISSKAFSRRMKEMGLTKEEIERGTLAGISDPSKSSLMKLGSTLDDIGILWLEPDRILFRGDTGNVEITREQYIRMDREANAGGINAYFGGVNPILIYRDAHDRTEQRLRVHVGDSWTLFGDIKDMNAYMERIKDWEGEKGEPETTY